MRKLKESEVRQRLESYTDPGVTEELYEFGRMLVTDITERTSHLETKAASIAAYSLGIITLLASTYSIWIGKVSTIGILIGVIAAFTATVYAVSAVTLQKYEGISQNEWFKADVLDSREMLRKFHLITMWGVFSSHEANAEKKASRIVLAQVALFIAAISIVASLAYPLAVFGFTIWL